MKRRIIPILISGLLMVGCSEIQPAGEDPVTVEKPGTGADVDPEPAEEPQSPSIPEDAPPLPQISYFHKTNENKATLAKLNKASFDISIEVAKQAESVIPNYKGNYNFSPISAAMCLGLIANSLDEPKDAEVAKVFGFDNLNEFNAIITTLLQYLPSPNGIELSLANSIWYSDMYTAKDEFRKYMADNFATSIFRRDFYSASTVDEINAWASRNTNDMINHVIDGIPPLYDILWLNAMYFQGEWDEKFDPGLTTDAEFHGVNNNTVKMMRQENLMRYSENETYRMTSIPFAGYGCFMDIILPKDANNKDFNTKISYETLQELLNNGDQAIVDLSMPRLKVDNSIRLSTIFTNLGFTQFDMTFHKMGLIGKYPVDAILIGQKCAFELDEDGAKLAAITGGMATSDGTVPQYKHIEMKIDRPFVYMIRESSTNAIVMMGYISNL